MYSYVFFFFFLISKKNIALSFLWVRDNQLTQVTLDGRLIYDCPIQLIYRDGLSKSTYSSLIGLIKINKSTRSFQKERRKILN